tara:strand:+ start:181 stop:372 length:192 start_codon:yes stop_codon:yes gene_type:complete
MEQIYEQFFGLMYHGRWDFQQAYNLPVGLRNWFLERLIKQKEKENEAVQQASKPRGGAPPRFS